MASEVAWLSFDPEQQRRTLLMMAALEEQGTVDQLGLGIIRDQITEELLPGISLLHTRARYLVFLPRIYQRLTGTRTDALITEGKDEEAKLTRQLISHYRDNPGDDLGIIGRLRGRETIQTASYAYWSILRRLGIVRIPGSLADYCRHRAEVNANKHAGTLFRTEDDVDLDVDDAWTELPKDPGPPVSFELTVDEAEWLRDRFLQSEQRPPERQSALAWLLHPDRLEWIEDVPSLLDHPQLDEFPPETGEVVRLGRDLDRLAHGARILYNWLCASDMPPGDRRDGLMERYETGMREWREETSEHGLPDQPRLRQLSEWMWKRLSNPHASMGARIRWTSTNSFLTSLRELSENQSDLLHSGRAAALIRDRESRLKPGRARLTNPELLTDWRGDSGYYRFDYNWAVARLALADIHHGLKTDVVTMEGAA